MSEQIEKDKIEKDKIYNCDCLEDEVSPDNTGKQQTEKGKKPSNSPCSGRRWAECTPKDLRPSQVQTR